MHYGLTTPYSARTRVPLLAVQDTILLKSQSIPQINESLKFYNVVDSIMFNQTLSVMKI